MDVIEAIHSRRSIRSYAPRTVPRELVEAVIWDAAQAPPPFSGEVPWTFNVVEGARRIAAYGERARQYTRDHHPEETGWSWTERADFEVFWGAPVLIVISGRAPDCCRAGQTLMLSAHARGLGTCWVGSPLPWLSTQSARDELAIPPEATPAAALCLGYPDRVPEATPRGRPTIVWAEPASSA